MILVRAADSSDEPFLWTMLYEAAHVAEHGMSLEDVRQTYDLARYVRGWGAPGDLGVVGEYGSERPGGAAWLRLLTGDNAGYGYVDDKTPELSIAVVPEFRGTGLGTALLRRLLDDAAGEYDAVCLSVRRSNPAYRLYERLGFTGVPGTAVTNWASTESVTMIRSLEQR